MRKKDIPILVLVLIFLISLYFFTANNQNVKRVKEGDSPSLTQKQITHAGDESAKPKTKLDNEKLKAEVDKLRLEADELLNTSNAPDKKWRWLTIWFTALGSTLLGIIGFFLNRTLKRTQQKRMEQDHNISTERHELEQSKLGQEKEFGRETHLLEVFRELGSQEPRIRIGAAAILIQRLKKIRTSANATNTELLHEFPMIMSVLIAETKHEQKEEIQKYIADGIANALDAIVPTPPDNQEPVLPPESPLKKYDFQGTKLHNAWWKRIDAREVDFYGASLVRASLREAFLEGAILKKADLTETVFEKARLKGANMQKAKLTSAKLAKADLRKAVLKDVDLSDSIIDGADFRGATFNNGAKLKKEQLDKARFSRDVARVVTIVN